MLQKSKIYKTRFRRKRESVCWEGYPYNALPYLPDCDCVFDSFHGAVGIGIFPFAQNRERVFVVSHRGGSTEYVFPQSVPLEKRLKDMLEPKVDEKYYLNQSKVDEFIAQLSPEKLKLLEDEG